MKTLILTASIFAISATIGACAASLESPELYNNDENKIIAESALIGPQDVNVECFNQYGEVNAYVEWDNQSGNLGLFDGGQPENAVFMQTNDNGYDVINGKLHVFLNAVYTLIYDNDGTYSIERDNDGHGFDIVRSGCVKVDY